MSDSVDVLIVGAGPVGLNMALALHNQGIGCRIIDSKSGIAETSNAIGVNARTLEIWQALGVTERAIEAGLKIHEIKLFSGGKLLNHAPLGQIESEFNFMLALPQPQTEALLTEELNKRNIKVEWNNELINLQDGTDSVLVGYGQNQDKINAKWVIGCDGHQSKVRQLAKMEQKCQELPQHFIMMDAVLDKTFSEITGVFHQSGALFFIPMRDKVRVVAEVSNDPKFKNLMAATPAIFTELLNDRFPGLTLETVLWLSDFRIHECTVENFRHGHVLLAGDAAHSHSPVGAQGMNTGIQDTWNLAWKLAHVIKHEAPPQLLNTYDIERHGIANDVLKRSGWLTKVATTENKFVRLLRNLGVGGILSIDLVRNKVVNSLAQTDICYKNSPLIDNDQVLYQNKTRYPTTGKRWLLLSKDDLIEAPDLPDFVMVEQNHLLWSDQALCLIRPDGYIAMYADSLFEIAGYFIENGIVQAQPEG